jgi:hypothetical protein
MWSHIWTQHNAKAKLKTLFPIQFTLTPCGFGLYVPFLVPFGTSVWLYMQCRLRESYT